MTHIDQIITDALAGSPETHIAILAREVLRLREARTVAVPPLPKLTGSRDDAPVWGMPNDLEDAFRQAGNPVLAAYQAGIRRGHAIAENSACTIPADRVLREGDIAVCKQVWSALLRREKQFFEAFRASKRLRDDFKLIEGRDEWLDLATKLAEKVGETFGVDVGEHSSAHCPVRFAIEFLDEKSTVDRVISDEADGDPASAPNRKPRDLSWFRQVGFQLELPDDIRANQGGADHA